MNKRRRRRKHKHVHTLKPSPPPFPPPPKQQQQEKRTDTTHKRAIDRPIKHSSSCYCMLRPQWALMVRKPPMSRQSINNTDPPHFWFSYERCLRIRTRLSRRRRIARKLGRRLLRLLDTTPVCVCACTALHRDVAPFSLRLPRSIDVDIVHGMSISLATHPNCPTPLPNNPPNRR